MTALPAGVGETFKDTVLTGPLVLAIPVAVLAGLVSFLSPCVLPLVPGYLSYVTGLTGADLADDVGGQRRRVLLGGLLFVLGFSVVFVSYGVLFGALGDVLRDHQTVLTRVLGGLTILLGLAFMGGSIPGLNREFRLHALPVTGLAGAPLLGVLFGLGWTPCIGPTLGAVSTLAATTGTAERGAVLSFAYCLGLGLPFLATGFAFERSMSAFAVVKRHYGLVLRIGGGMLVLIGLLLVTGVWDRLVTHLQTWISGFAPAV